MITRTERIFCDRCGECEELAEVGGQQARPAKVLGHVRLSVLPNATAELRLHELGWDLCEACFKVVADAARGRHPNEIPAPAAGLRAKGGGHV